MRSGLLLDGEEESHRAVHAATKRRPGASVPCGDAARVGGAGAGELAAGAEHRAARAIEHGQGVREAVQVAAGQIDATAHLEPTATAPCRYAPHRPSVRGRERAAGEQSRPGAVVELLPCEHQRIGRSYRIAGNAEAAAEIDEPARAPSDAATSSAADG